MADWDNPTLEEWQKTHGGSSDGYTGPGGSGTYRKVSDSDPRVSGKTSGEPDWGAMAKAGASLAEIAEKRRAWKKAQAAKVPGAAAQGDALKPSPSPSPQQ